MWWDGFYGFGFVESTLSSSFVFGVVWSTVSFVLWFVCASFCDCPRAGGGVLVGRCWLGVLCLFYCRGCGGVGLRVGS